MVKTEVKCIHCQSKNIVKYGKQANGTPHCKCKDCGKTFQVKYVNKGVLPETKKMIVKMALNGSGVRDTSRVLEISKDTVTKTLKNKVGKKNTQKIERKHLTFRTRLKRLARKTICYSKSLDMHKILVGLLINHIEFQIQLV